MISILFRMVSKDCPNKTYLILKILNWWVQATPNSSSPKPIATFLFKHLKAHQTRKCFGPTSRFSGSGQQQIKKKEEATSNPFTDYVPDSVWVHVVGHTFCFCLKSSKAWETWPVPGERGFDHHRPHLIHGQKSLHSPKTTAQSIHSPM